MHFQALGTFHTAKQKQPLAGAADLSRLLTDIVTWIADPATNSTQSRHTQNSFERGCPGSLDRRLHLPQVRRRPCHARVGSDTLFIHGPLASVFSAALTQPAGGPFALHKYFIKLRFSIVQSNMQHSTTTSLRNTNGMKS